MSKHLPLLLLLMSLASFAQTPAYTDSVSFACNQNVCNRVPLDQGGTTQFIEANEAFSISSNGFDIFGNPGSGTGGMHNIVDDIPLPIPLQKNGSVGAEGTLTFDWTASGGNQGGATYSGHEVVQGHRVTHCNNHGCWRQLIVDGLQIYIN